MRKVRGRSSLVVAAVMMALLDPPVLAAPVVQESESIGDVAFPISCAAEAQEPFDHAVALLHHMTYSQARAEFSTIAANHPQCAMAYWGIAMTLFQPLWPTRPTPDDMRRGREVLSRAQRMDAGSERERLYIAAASAFFESTDAGYWERIEQWAERSRHVHEAYPDDIEAAAFFALSHLAVAPAAGGGKNNDEAALVIKGILRKSPTHPGAIHYLIHANDADGRQGESLDVVERYSTIAPRNPHALHMPTHIYVRLGRWQRVIDGNRQAAVAALENPAGDEGQWVWDEFPHAIEYLVYGLLQIGDDSTAAEQIQRLRHTPDLQPSFKTAFHLSSIPARYALERHDWAMARDLEPRPGEDLEWARFPWPEAVTWFARGIGAARLGDIQAGRAALARLSVLQQASADLGEDLFARQTEILRLGVDAWVSLAAANHDRAIELMEEAVELEANTPKHPVTPAPTLPAAELLGDLLLELDRPAASLEAYRTSLEHTPGRLNSIVGAARAADRSGDTIVAVRYYRQAAAGIINGSPRAELVEARAYLERQGGDRPTQTPSRRLDSRQPWL